MPAGTLSTSSVSKEATPAGASGIPDAASVAEAIAVLKRADPREVQRQGYHFVESTVFCPLCRHGFLDKHREEWKKPKEPLEIDWRLDRQLEVAREVSRFVGELRDIPADSADKTEYHWNNGAWSGPDAIVQYGLVRSRRPKRFVEVGTGSSTLLLAKAVARNASEGHATQVDLIEPYPRREMFEKLPADWRRHDCILQRAPMSVFEALGAGDVLFIDGSHVAKVYSDVTHLFFQILPRLASGVLIHLHDIFLPEEYPEHWMYQWQWSPNEQYVLQAFLMHNSAYRVELASCYLHHKHRETLERLYQSVQPTWGSSLWMIKN